MEKNLILDTIVFIVGVVMYCKLFNAFYSTMGLKGNVLRSVTKSKSCFSFLYNELNRLIFRLQLAVCTTTDVSSNIAFDFHV